MNNSPASDCLRAGISLRASQPGQQLAEHRSAAAGAAAKPAVLLFHGMTGTPDELVGLAEFIHNKGYDVFVPCLSGHGQTIEELRKTRARQWLADARECFREARRLGFDRVVVIGLSFGTLLALELATSFPDEVCGAVLMSAPLQFKHRKVERTLTLLSLLPELLLDRLGSVPKPQRPEGIFIKERITLDSHSLGASARLFKIRRRIKRRLSKLRCPLLMLHDPEDHHLVANVPELMQSLTPSKIEVELVPKGEHELTIGRSYQQVFSAIGRFLDRLESAPAAGAQQEA